MVENGKAGRVGGEGIFIILIEMKTEIGGHLMKYLGGTDYDFPLSDPFESVHWKAVGLGRASAC